MKKIISFVALLAALFSLTLICISAAEPAHPFNDVMPGAWYEKPVVSCYENGYMAGTSDTAFSPNASVTRGMVVTIFAVADGYNPYNFTEQSFEDVKSDAWYFKGANWASKNGVSVGYEDGTFKPDKSISRQELATMFSAFANHLGNDTIPKDLNILDRFKDKNLIAGYAESKLAWAVENGIMSGNADGTLNPAGTATRAELAVMINAFSRSFLPLAENVKLSSAFTDNMIIQRDEKTTVWGWADESDNGNFVKVTLDGVYAYGKVVDGAWEAVFGTTFEASAENVTLKVTAANSTKTINNILFGDVYYVIGQSNVHYSILELEVDNRSLGNTVTFDFDNSRNIRFFRNSNQYYVTNTGDRAMGTPTLYEDYEGPKPWQTPSDVEADYKKNYPSDIKNFPERAFASNDVFSALGYMFAYNMSNTTDVPIGVIEIDASGFPLIAFAPNELAEKWGTEAYDPTTGTYYYDLLIPGLGHLTNPILKTRFGYNQQIHPLSKFSTAGILWYQGESDWASTQSTLGIGADTFQTQFAELMNFYRNDFGNSDFPVYIIEFPSCFDAPPTHAYIATGDVRTELGTIPQILDNTYIVSSSDFFNNSTWQNNIHPYIKHLQAERLTNIVLATNGYDVDDKYDINYVSGPVLSSVKYIDDNNISLNFKYVGDELKYFDEMDEGVQGVELYVNGVWVYCNAENIKLDGDTMNINYTDGKIDGVRYNANTSAIFAVDVTLCNSDYIPAVAFIDFRK